MMVMMVVVINICDDDYDDVDDDLTANHPAKQPDIPTSQGPE